MKTVSGLLAMALTLPAAAADELRFRFIGNEAFEITDGEQTLLTDFPYRSGYSIYMEYPDSEIRRRENSLCLITHRHGDHFEPSLFDEIGCLVVGPSEVTGQVEKNRVLETAVMNATAVIRSGSISVHPVRTPHRELEHFSYLVVWHGLRLWFVGDTEETTHIPDDLDVLFVSPWLLAKLEAEGRRPARHVVVYHHAADEQVECDDCRVPRQGEAFVIKARENR